MTAPASSLDERYLAFCARTAPAFAAHPQLEALRRFVFQELLTGRRGMTWRRRARRWVRPLRRRARTTAVPPAEVLLWVESGREVIVDALLPVYRELMRRDVRVALVAEGIPQPAPNLPPEVVRFAYRPAYRTPAWAAEGWDALAQTEPALRGEPFRSAFLDACVVLQGRLDENDRLLDSSRAQRVVFASAQLQGGAALAVTARARGTRSFLLQHGILQPFYTPLIADVMLTWGAASDDTLAALGVSRACLVACGSPRHDAMWPTSDRVKARSALRAALQLRSVPTFVFFSNGNDLERNGDAPAICAQWLHQVARRHAGEWNVVVRLHPNEDGSVYRNVRHVVLTRDTPNLGETLDGCDWLGSLCSTVLYDGLIYGKQAWQFHADGWPRLADNWERGLATRIASAADLNRRVEAMLQGEVGARSDVPLERVFTNHGRATQAVADAILASVERPRTAEQAAVWAQ